MSSATEPKQLEDVQGDGRWMSQHKRFMYEAKEREPEVVFIGDSLIQQLQFSEIWVKMFQPLHSLNFGIGGDQTQHVLWRVENGEMDDVQPKVVVLLVGTNNYDHTDKEVTEGILAIVKAIQERQSQAQIIVLGIPPRGEKPNPLREKISKINEGLCSKLSGTPNISFLNAEFSSFINSEGLIDSKDMYDYLHFTNEGYRKFCEPLVEEVQSLLQTFLKVENTSMHSSSTADLLCNDTT
ncbi:platelet-activating factor acetylhydrolase IB subunit alpha2-like isoform X3 [Mytilus galloprovincialis]|uniref:platelet-activating factor acetylhydrolase IB subunit alpha2-like n=1 Tax=Mytilus trossulus TaxID=6551 RepID=UPI003004B573